jgi:hypothetical protein
MLAIGRIAKAAILHDLCPKGMGVSVKKVNYKKHNSLGKNCEVRTTVLTPCSFGLLSCHEVAAWTQGQICYTSMASIVVCFARHSTIQE